MAIVLPERVFSRGACRMGLTELAPTGLYTLNILPVSPLGAPGSWQLAGSLHTSAAVTAQAAAKIKAVKNPSLNTVKTFL